MFKVPLPPMSNGQSNGVSQNIDKPRDRTLGMTRTRRRAAMQDQEMNDFKEQPNKKSKNDSKKASAKESTKGKKTKGRKK